MNTPPSLDDLQKIASSPYDHSCREYAVRLGFCEALSEVGLSPTDLSLAMTKSATIKRAESGNIDNPPEYFDWSIGALVKLTAALVAAGAVTGTFTGKAHHDLENRMNKLDASGIPKLRQTAEELAEDRDELREDLLARNISVAPPLKKKRAKTKSTSKSPGDLLDFSPI